MLASPWNLILTVVFAFTGVYCLVRLIAHRPPAGAPRGPVLESTAIHLMHLVMSVGMIAIIINNIAPRNFPFTICHTDKGLVNNNSSVPCFLSSEKLRMVTAGIRKIKIHGAIVKNGVKSAKPEFKML